MNKFSLIFALLFSMVSCGGGSDGSDGADAPAPQEEEDTGGGTTGGTGGGSSGGSGGGTACLTERQREDIRAFLNRASELPENGTASDPDIDWTSYSVDFNVVSASSWTFIGEGCADTPEGPQCEQGEQILIEFRDGCFFWDNRKVTIRSSSSTRLSIKTSARSEAWIISGSQLQGRRGNFTYESF